MRGAPWVLKGQKEAGSPQYQPREAPSRSSAAPKEGRGEAELLSARAAGSTPTGGNEGSGEAKAHAAHGQGTAGGRRVPGRQAFDPSDAQRGGS